MHTPITIQPISKSKISSVDFDNIPFGKIFTDRMFVADYKDGKWENYRIVPFDYLPLHPSNLAIHYGQSIFEGMKATKLENGQAVFLRPDKHSDRINNSAKRMMMPEFPKQDFLDAIHTLVELESNWIPTNEGSSLYLRPFMFACDESIGVRPSSNYTFMIICCPVGPYYSKPVKLLAEEHYIRAAKGGVGYAKTAGNYAAAMMATHEANMKGFDQVLWLDAKEFEYVQEVGTMNIFFVIDDVVITPEIESGTILPGITRDSVILLLRDRGYKVEERPLSMFEVLDAHRSNRLKECFGTGTAAVMTHVSEISWREKTMVLPDIEERPIGEMIKNEINGIRSGRLPDQYGWLVPVSALVTV